MKGRRRQAISVNDRMQSGYRYRTGSLHWPQFRPELTPKQMLELGVFCGKYMTDARKEFPTPLCVALQSEHRYGGLMARNEQEESDQGYELLTVQCRMARAGLAWGVRDLAGAAHVSADTVARFERGEVLRRSTVRAIRTALEDAGCEFIREDDVSGPGMRMRKRPVKIGG
jgi:hypothetical protein